MNALDFASTFKIIPAELRSFLAARRSKLERLYRQHFKDGLPIDLLRTYTSHAAIEDFLTSTLLNKTDSTDEDFIDYAFLLTVLFSAIQLDFRPETDKRLFKSEYVHFVTVNLSKSIQSLVSAMSNKHLCVEIIESDKYFDSPENRRIADSIIESMEINHRAGYFQQLIISSNNGTAQEQYINPDGNGANFEFSSDKLVSTGDFFQRKIGLLVLYRLVEFEHYDRIFNRLVSATSDQLNLIALDNYDTASKISHLLLEKRKWENVFLKRLSYGSQFENDDDCLLILNRSIYPLNFRSDIHS